MAWTKDHLDCQKQWLVESNKLNSELLVIALTNQPSATASPAVTLPPYNPDGGPTETQPTPAPYSDGDIHMGNVDDSVTDNLYQ